MSKRIMKMDKTLFSMIYDIIDDFFLDKECKSFKCCGKKYYVFKTGDIYTHYKSYGWKNEKLKKLKGSTNYKNKYNSISLNKKSFYRHRIIANLYINNPLDLPCVNHKDGNKLNNDVSNLEWVTWSQNHFHSYNELGRKGPKYGEDCGGYGVFFRKDRNKFVAYLDRYGKRTYLGHFITEEEACQAREMKIKSITQNIITMGE